MGERLKAKPQLSRWEREGRRRRILAIVIAVAIVAVLGLIGYGYYDTRIKPWHQPIVKVNDRVFDMRYYVKMLRLWGADLSAEEVVTMIIEPHELMRQAAEELNINISEEEVEQELKSLFGFNPDEESEEAFSERYQEWLEVLRLSDQDFRQMFIEPMLLEEKLKEEKGEDFDFSAWLEEERGKAEIESYLDEEKKAWALTHMFE